MSGLRGPLLVAAATALLAAGMVLNSRLGEALFVVATVLMPVALLALIGADGRTGRGARWAAAVVLVVLAIGFGLLLALSGRPPAGPRWFGLPAPLAVQIGMALLPLTILGILFARGYDRFRPSSETLEAIRSLDDAES